MSQTRITSKISELTKDHISKKISIDIVPVIGVDDVVVVTETVVSIIHINVSF